MVNMKKDSNTKLHEIEENKKQTTNTKKKMTIKKNLNPLWTLI
jgi:hypothetical protein